MLSLSWTNIRFFKIQKQMTLEKLFFIIKYLKKESLKRLSICYFQFVVIISTLFIKKNPKQAKNLLINMKYPAIMFIFTTIIE